MESLEFSGWKAGKPSLFEKQMGKICIYVYTFVFINISLLPNTAEVEVVGMLTSKPKAFLAKNVISGYKCFH